MLTFQLNQFSSSLDSAAASTFFLFSYFSCSVHTQHNVVEIITFKSLSGWRCGWDDNDVFLAVFATGVLLVNEIDILSIKFHKRRDIYTVHTCQASAYSRSVGGNFVGIIHSWATASFKFCTGLSFNFSPVSNVLAFAEITMVGWKSFLGEKFQNR